MRTVLVGAFGAIFSVSAALAASPSPAAGQPSCTAMIEAISPDPLNSPLHDWVDANRLKIAGLLDLEEADRFEALIGAGRCTDAQAMLEAAFRRQFPEMACFFEGTPNSRRDRRHVWHSYIATGVYPDLSLCFARQNLAEGRAAFASAGVDLPRVEAIDGYDQALRDFGPLAAAVSKLYLAFWAIDSDCRFSRYQPACVALARLAAEGKLVERPDDLIFFLLLRVRIAGYGDAMTTALEAEVGARLSDTEKEAAEARARESLADIAAGIRRD